METRHFVAIEAGTNFILSRSIGFLTEEDARTFHRMTAEAVEKLPPGVPVRILTDASRAGKADPRARKIMMRSFSEPRLHRMAVYGARPMVRTMMKFFLYLSGSKRIRLFATEAEARAWLAE